jgi:cyclic pyranopterin phosphate synthase
VTVAPLPLPQFAQVRQGRPPTVPPRAPDSAHAARRLLDSHGRTIRDLRLSLTDRCNFRCTYCMEPDVRFAAPDALLQAHDFVRLARVAAGLGVTKIRLTGGEPTLHPALGEIIAGIRVHTGCEIALTTNGSTIDRASLRAWKAAGLDRVTISLDSLRPGRFAAITRAACTPARVLAAIDDCVAEGLAPVKVNAVLVRGVNDDEAADLAALARRPGVQVRFIEWMPLDSGRAWDAGRWVSAAETRAAIERRFPLVALHADDPSSTARTFAFADGHPGSVGFIAPVSSPFCGACSRLRITADGMVRPCLFSLQEWDIRGALRTGRDAEVAAFLIDATFTKQPGHGIAKPGFRPPERPMSAIGG